MTAAVTMSRSPEGLDPGAPRMKPYMVEPDYYGGAFAETFAD